MDLAAGEGLGRVAIVAAQGTAGEADKDSGKTGGAGFTLERIEDFGKT